MLDDVEAWALLERPAGEHPPPAVVRAAYINLQKRAGILLDFPRSGLLAGPQADYQVA
jgi:hypothetical protein